MDRVVEIAEVHELLGELDWSGHWDRNRSMAEQDRWPTASEAVRWGRARAPVVWIRVGRTRLSAGEVVSLEAPRWAHADSLDDAPRESDYTAKSGSCTNRIPKLVRTAGPWFAHTDVEPPPE